MPVSQYYNALLATLGGVFVATFITLTPPQLLFLMCGAVVLVLLWRRGNDEAIGRWFLYLGITLAFFAIGALRTQWVEESFGQSVLAPQVGQEITIEGLVAKEPELREATKHVYVRQGEDLLLVTTDRYATVAYGDTVTVTGTLSKPESFTTDFGRTFNYAGYLLARGVEYQLAFATIEIIRSGDGNPVITWLLQLKAALQKSIEKSLPEPAAGLGEGLLLGVKQALGEELTEAFRKTGIIHVVVLSGYNVMLVVAFVMYILSYFFSVRVRVVFGLLAITGFALMVGLSATVVRASLMAGLLIIAQATGRQYLVLRALLLTAVVMVCINPFLLVFDTGFQLSFMATLGLILIAPHLERWLPKVSFVQNFLVATVAAQVAVLPLLLYQIGEFSVVAIVVNLLVLPMVPIAMLLTAITGVVAVLMPALSMIVAFPTYWSLTYINQIALWFASVPFASFGVPVFPWYIVPISYALMGYLLGRFYRPELGPGYSEIAERLIKVNQKPTTELNLSDWKIEEEVDHKSPQFGVNKTGDSSHSDESPVTLPIFFR